MEHSVSQMTSALILYHSVWLCAFHCYKLSFVRKLPYCLSHFMRDRHTHTPEKIRATIWMSRRKSSKALWTCVEFVCTNVWIHLVVIICSINITKNTAQKFNCVIQIMSHNCLWINCCLHQIHTFTSATNKQTNKQEERKKLEYETKWTILSPTVAMIQAYTLKIIHFISSTWFQRILFSHRATSIILFTDTFWRF